MTKVQVIILPDGKTCRTLNELCADEPDYSVYTEQQQAELMHSQLQWQQAESERKMFEIVPPCCKEYCEQACLFKRKEFCDDFMIKNFNYAVGTIHTAQINDNKATIL